MKSRISFFNLTVFRKNLTRFAPAWVLYSILTLLFMLSFAGMDPGVGFASSLGEMTPFAGAVSLCYALLNAQLLFGDLYSSRMCNALHALPIRRETWFGTNVLTGLAFCVGPNVVFALIFLPLCGGVWQAPLLWLAVSVLQYVFFFGIAVLSAHCVGNRFAMVLVYGIINFISLIVYFLVQNLYEPLLYGITVSDEIFSLLCPAVQIIGNGYFEVRYDVTAMTAVFRELVFEEGWWYLLLAALVGVGATVLGLVLYRRRNLECAGDFVAARRLEPVFLILYTACAGVFCLGFFSLFLGEDNYLFLILGLTIGFFTGLMLLHRTVRVFRKKSLLGFVVLLAVFGVSLLLTVLDPLGITRWMPKAEQVQSVRVSTNSSGYKIDDESPLNGQQDIADILTIHEQCLRQRTQWYTGSTIKVSLSYTLKSGAVVRRNYDMAVDTDAGAVLKDMLSKPEVVLGELYTAPQAQTLVQAQFGEADLLWERNADLQGLVDAIAMDCRAGVMAQDWVFMDERDFVGWIYLEARLSNGIYAGWNIRFTTQCTNTVAWLEANSDFSLEAFLEDTTGAYKK